MVNSIFEVQERIPLIMINVPDQLAQLLMRNTSPLWAVCRSTRWRFRSGRRWAASLERPELGLSSLVAGAGAVGVACSLS